MSDSKVLSKVPACSTTTASAASEATEAAAAKTPKAASSTAAAAEKQEQQPRDQLPPLSGANKRDQDQRKKDEMEQG